MSIEAINEQLLRAVGVGIAVFRLSDLKLEFHNDVFETWFAEGELADTMNEIFPTLEIEPLREKLADSGQFNTEWQFRKKRRTMVITQNFMKTAIGGEDTIILECQNITRIRELESMIESYSNMVERNTRELQKEKEQVEKLLLNTMPRAAYEEFKNFGVVAPQKFEEISVLVLDFIGFSKTFQDIAPATLVGELNEIFSAFDQIGNQFGCERIKTTGDQYLCVTGMHERSADHAVALANAAVRFIRFIRNRNTNAEHQWQCRAGIGTGSAIGSVIGVQKYVYDVFGEAVVRANEARLMAHSLEILAGPETLRGITEEPEHQKPRSTEAFDLGYRALTDV